MTTPTNSDPRNILDYLQAEIYAQACKNGFWPPDITPTDAVFHLPSKIALMHSELSEALEYLRSGNGPDDKVPELPGALVEFADCVIRILDVCGAMGWSLGDAIVRKHAFNKTRPYKHGKAF